MYVTIIYYAKDVQTMIDYNKHYVRDAFVSYAFSNDFVRIVQCSCGVLTTGVILDLLNIFNEWKYASQPPLQSTYKELYIYIYIQQICFFHYHQ
uniref:Uncharacterized protein n=1 Tax=Glossina palpalis gambiensis TaxID=67801 RepID=A0A1B0BDV3_9MUSC